MGKEGNTRSRTQGRGVRECVARDLCTCVHLRCVSSMVKGRCYLLASVNPEALQSKGLTGRMVLSKSKTNQIPC